MKQNKWVEEWMIILEYYDTVSLIEILCKVKV
jgi:hypothetical protein